MVHRLDELARAVEARLRTPAARRLVARLRRHQNILLAGLVGLGILLMMIHWAGAPPGRTAHGPAAPAPRPELSVHAEAGPAPR